MDTTSALMLGQLGQLALGLLTGCISEGIEIYWDRSTHLQRPRNYILLTFPNFLAPIAIAAVFPPTMPWAVGHEIGAGVVL